jgi:hypothetical protein
MKGAQVAKLAAIIHFEGVRVGFSSFADPSLAITH